ncbi:hypothetical protein GUJ93_ZPchr0013g35045 [Zizania palustris]|uniref:Uncharacterized protein n=1 Tax=Zizania palustris TaxID=103762 RepID=A0A8J5X851_ZIZPA|nr:hypothetical protein GUJ93_ZPchr0013g35045 [Zizania palustris]
MADRIASFSDSLTSFPQLLYTRDSSDYEKERASDRKPPPEFPNLGKNFSVGDGNHMYLRPFAVSFLDASLPKSDCGSGRRYICRF